MKKYFHITLLLYVSINICNAENFNFRHYKAENGLNSNSVNSILQDKFGFIWIGTERGLNRYDGFIFRSFYIEKKESKTIFNSLVSALFESRNGEIWIGSDDGIYIFNQKNEKITRFQAKADDVEISTLVNEIKEDKSGNIWISTYGQGVFRYKTETAELVQYRVALNGKTPTTYDFLNTIFVDHANRIWAAPNSVNCPILLFNHSKNTFEKFELKSETSGLTVYKMFEDSYRNLWLGTWDKGICKLSINDRNVQSFLSPKEKNGILHIHDIAEYSANKLLIGSDDGLSLFNTKDGSHQLFTSSEVDYSAISDKFIYPILKDKEGGIWIGTYYGGINYISPSSGFFERYTHSKYFNSVNGNVIGNFAEDKNGNIWIASDDGGLNYFNTKSKKFTSYTPDQTKNSLSYHNVHALCVDDDKLWIGTYSGGINVFDSKTGKFKLYSSDASNPKTLDGNSSYSIFKDMNDQLWIASMTGINLYNRETDDFVRVKQFNTTTIDIKQDKKGWLWFATLTKGLYKYNQKTNQWKNYLFSTNGKQTESMHILNCIFFDSKDRLWVGGANGLFEYDYKQDRFNHIKLDVPSNNICWITEDRNDLWLTTSKGLIRYNTISNTHQVFTKSDGLVDDQFLPNSGLKSSTGEIYIGTASGFNVFHPKNTSINRNIPVVAITDIDIFNRRLEVNPKGTLKQSLQHTERIDLSHKENVFTISFVALSYTTPEKNQYAYKLEGFDREWNYVNRQNNATYTNLGAGRYVFRVKASNGDGIWNENGTSLIIVKHPPFWFNTFFKILYVVLGGLILFYIINKYRKNTERKHSEKIKILNQEKEKELYNAKIEFFTMIAHEIRTPVSLIIGPLEKILSNNTEVTESILTDLNIIDRNSQRLLCLINQLLDFRKIEQGSISLNFSKQNIYQLLKNISDRFKPTMERKMISFNLDCVDKKSEIIVDSEAITKIISNLLANAIKFTKNQINLICFSLPTENSIIIKISDNGPGISDSEKNKIFKPFYQIEEEQKRGTGIGLSIVKSLVEAHGGSISVSDTYPKGSVFTVNLPLTNKESVIISEEKENEEKVWEENLLNNQKTSEMKLSRDTSLPVLLIVEDNKDLRNFLHDNFIDDYVVHTAANGIEGLEILKQNDVNLIISDLMMPKMDGLELCKEVRSNILWSHVPFVLLTAKNDMESKIDSLNFGADSYIVKPFSLDYLKAQINNLIESRTMLRKRFAELPFVPLKSVASNLADDKFLSKMNSIIENNISNIDFSIDKLAEQLNISRSGLFAKIKMLTDVTPNELIILIRLKKAAELLAQNKYRVNEVAYMVGFNNPSYFTKCFQKQFGIRPGEYVHIEHN